MDVPLMEFNLLDLERELYARGLDTTGTKQDRYNRLFAAGQAISQIPSKQRGAILAKLGARVQLENFAELRTFIGAECDILDGKLQWRLEHVRRTEDGGGLEYFHADVLSRIDPSKTYMLNIDELLVRQEPYVHKLFVICVSRTDGTDLKLCYARSLSKLRSWDESLEEFDFPIITNENIASSDADIGFLQTTLIQPEDLARALAYVLTELRNKEIKNYVAIACDEHRLGMSVVVPLLKEAGFEVPTIVWDIRELQKIFRNMFSSACFHCTIHLADEIYAKDTYNQQLIDICNSNNSKNVNAILLLVEHVNRLPEIMLNMWKFEEHIDKPISVSGLNNDLLRLYLTHVKQELPPVTYEDCAAGAGLLQLLVFDALWCLCPAPVTEPDDSEAPSTSAKR